MRVIVATDGSADAEAAVSWARLLPLPRDSEVLVVSAVPPPDLPALPDWESEARRAAVHVAHHAMDSAAAQLAGTVERRLLEGDPRVAIIAAARDWGADLVVIGARGLGAVKEFFVGSVSIAIARHAPCPVVVCKGTARPVRTITVAHDGSPSAQAALAFVAGLPLAPTTRVRVVGVTAPLHYGTTALAALGSTLRAAVAGAEEQRRRALERTLRAQLSELGSPLTAGLIAVVGNPASTILDEADAADTDLLVVGARGLGPMKRLALGSVSESIVRHALCPVLVVRGR